MKKIIGIFIVVTIALTSCYRVKSYPPEPSIEYVYFTLTDTVDVLDNPVLSGTLRFSFIDGDGDVGDRVPADTSLIDSVKHVFLTLLKKDQGVFVEQELLVDYQYRIPYFDPGANNPVLKGDIIVDNLNFQTPFSSDTLKFNFYMKDRAGHKSNIEETPVFIPKDSVLAAGK